MDEMAGTTIGERRRAAAEALRLDDDALERACEETFFVGSGPGGQHRNKAATAVRLFHPPSGLTVTATERRSQASSGLPVFASRLATMPTASPYSVHPSVAYVEAIVANLEANTGRPLEAWLRMVRSSGPKDVRTRAAWLKAQGLGSTQAALVAERSMGTRSSAFDQTAKAYLRAAPRYIERQYGGKKAGLRPLYQRLLALGLSVGSEARACPCETIVPLYRNHVFAQLKPTTLTRIDLGLALGDPTRVKDPSGRLVDTGGFAKKDRITHRIPITRAEEIDGVVKRWLRAAYHRDA